MIHALRVRIALACVAATLAGAQLARAQAPAVAVSIAGSTKLVSDVKYLLNSAGVGNMGATIDFIAGPYLAELDGEKPAGVLATFDDNGDPKWLAFLPIKDLNSMLAKVEAQVGRPQDAGNGVKKIGLDRPIFIKEHKGYVYVADSQSGLSTLPDDPSVHLQRMPKLYVLAATVNVRSIPEPLRQMAVSEMRAGFERQMAQQRPDDPIEAQMQEQMSRNFLDSMTRLVEESEKIMIGWAIDEERQSTYIDFHLVAVPGTKLAEQMGGLKNSESHFTSMLMPNAALNMNFNTNMTSDDIDQAMMSMDAAVTGAKKKLGEEIPDDQTRAAVERMLAPFFGVLKKTIQGGRLDAGMAVLLDNKTPQFVAGGLAVDARELEKAVQEALEMLKKDPNAPKFTVDKSSHAGVDLHLLSADIPPGEDEARAILGDKIHLTVGLDDKRMFLGFGKDNEALVKKAIDESGTAKSAMPMQMNLSVKPIVEFAAAMEDSPQVRAMRAALSNVGDKDHVRVTMKSIPNGESFRLEIERGVLQSIGAASSAGGEDSGF